jgi:hypothetical protein
MTIRQTNFAAAFALAAIGPAHAEGLKPLQGRVIDLGDVSAVAYYTVERDGFRVVGTLCPCGSWPCPRPKPDALHPARGGHPGRRGRDHQAGRHGARLQGGRGGHVRGGHELSDGRLWATPRKASRRRSLSH